MWSTPCIYKGWNDIYMLVKKEYPLSRGVLTQMLAAKLLVEQNNEMSRELLRKILMMAERPRRPRNAAWFKEKAMSVEAQESGQILDEEKLAFLADPGIPDGQAAQTTILNTAAL
ncbi:hypothetical protein Tco_0417380 [Tanacetum coccineum]